MISKILKIPILLDEKSLVIGCTTNPGDCNDFQEALKDTGIDIFYNPEFIAQGSIIRDLQNADMVLLVEMEIISQNYHRYMKKYRWDLLVHQFIL